MYLKFSITFLMVMAKIGTLLAQQKFIGNFYKIEYIGNPQVGNMECVPDERKKWENGSLPLPSFSCNITVVQEVTCDFRCKWAAIEIGTNGNENLFYEQDEPAHISLRGNNDTFFMQIMNGLQKCIQHDMCPLVGNLTARNCMLILEAGSFPLSREWKLSIMFYDTKSDKSFGWASWLKVEDVQMAPLKRPSNAQRNRRKHKN